MKQTEQEAKDALARRMADIALQAVRPTGLTPIPDEPLE